MHSAHVEELRAAAPLLVKKHPELAADLQAIGEARDGRQVLARLEQLQKALDTKSCQPGVTESYLTSLVKQLANPALLNQGGDITCTQVSALWTVFKSEPLHAASLAVSLATEGQARLKGGKVITLKREDLEADSESDVGRFDKRTQSEKALQRSMFRAFSEQVAGVDGNGNPTTQVGTSVMTLLEQRAQVTGVAQVGITRENDIRRLFREAIAERNGGESIKGLQVVLNFMPKGSHALHCVSVEGLEVDQKGEAWVKVYHGWGKYYSDMGGIPRKRDERSGLESIRLEDFLKNSEIVVANRSHCLVSSLGIQSSIDEYLARHSDTLLFIDPGHPELFKPKKSEEKSVHERYRPASAHENAAFDEQLQSTKNIDPSLEYAQQSKKKA